MSEFILVINPGSTSTKIAMYDAETKIWADSMEHSLEFLAVFDTIYDQLDMRYELVVQAVEDRGMKLSDLAAVISRGGPFARVRSGAYEVNEDMLHTMRYNPIDQHASNIGMSIAYRIAQQVGIKAYIYDAVTVDEMEDLTRIVGLQEMSRRGQGHNLNMRAAALKLCREEGWNYHGKNIVVAHLGGGISLSLHSHGRIVDMISDDEGPFSPERAGGLPGVQLIDLCYDGGMDKKEMFKHIQRRGGLISLLGTADTREVERRASEGDGKAKLVYEAMALSVAKNIAKLSVVVKGNVDAVILTGGIARSKMFTEMVRERVSFIAPMKVLPGENEMDALAGGALRVLRGEESAHIYRIPEKQ